MKLTLLLLVLFIPAAFADGKITAIMVAGGKQTNIEIAGIDASALAACKKRPADDPLWEKAIRVVVGTGDEKEIARRSSLDGAWTVSANDRLIFTPRHAFVPGLTYRLYFQPNRLTKPEDSDRQVLTFDLSIPKPKRAATKVEQIYPTRDKLPENQLKFYIFFSTSMSRGDAYDHLQLLDSKGKAIDKAFLELGEELWDKEQKRFTLLFDPGRIKRGLKPREDLGPVLEEGKSYTLVIGKDWRDANGEPLDGEVRKRFTVGAPDETPPDVKKWKLTTPIQGMEVLRVKSPESLDYALFNRLLRVEDSSGNMIAGSIRVGEEETLWEFTPKAAWKPGKYRLVIDKLLEDLAGNGIDRKFEVDVTREPLNRSADTETELPFVVPPPMPKPKP